MRNKLAIDGGDPVRQSLLPYSRHYISKSDKKAVMRVLESNWIAGNGPECKRLEDELAEYTGYKYAVVVSNATAALQLAYNSIFIKGRTIHLPTLSFIATANAATINDLHPIFLDANRKTLTTDHGDIGVSLGGYPIFQSTVADNAQYVHRGMAFFQNNIISVHSFHAVKQVTGGEGGAILTNNSDIAEECRLLADHNRREGLSYGIGYNFRLSDIQAALIRSQLQREDSNIIRRRQIAALYFDAFKDHPNLIVPGDHVHHAWHLFILRLKNINRDWFRAALKAEGIGTQIHYRPIHMQPQYESHRNPLSLAHAELAYSQMVSIPMFSSMRKKDVTDVIAAIKKVLDYA